jgi:hypothetical protein
VRGNLLQPQTSLMILVSYSCLHAKPCALTPAPLPLHLPTLNLLLLSPFRWLVSYDVEESSDSQTGIDVVEGHRENAVVGNGAPEQVRRVGGITGGGIYFDEEEGRVEESPGKASGLCAGNGTESGKDARSVVKDARDEVCRAIEEWVHPRFVRPRSIRCLAGECPPEPGTGVLATYRSDGRELYYDADVMDVRFWAREQHVLVQYVHGDIVGCSKWLLLSDVFRVADSTSILDEQRCNKLERNGKHTDASAHSVVDVMMQNGKDDLKILDSEGEQTMTSVLPQSQPGMGDGKKDRKKTCANVKTSSVVILHGMSDLSMHSNALDGSAVVAVDAHLRGPSGIQGVQQNEKDEVDYGEILRTWRTALPEMVNHECERARIQASVPSNMHMCVQMDRPPHLTTCDTELVMLELNR